jgi:hypothetical protein
MLHPRRDAVDEIGRRGFTVIPGREFASIINRDDWFSLVDDWNHLEIDPYMPDGGRYRLRRFGRFSFVPSSDELRRLPHAAVYQDRTINRFAGGISRNFAALRDVTFENQCLLTLIRFDFACFAAANVHEPAAPWRVLIHQVRIQAEPRTSASPTPEGVHRDNHDFIAMHMIARQNVRGGESSVYDTTGRLLHRRQLDRPLDTLYVDDANVLHGVDAISSADDQDAGTRDMLIIDFDIETRCTGPEC